MKLLKLGVAFSIGLLMQFSAYSQEKNPFNLPADLAVPKWVQLTDWGHANVHRIDSLIELYKDAPRKATAISEPDEQSEDADFFEDPYLTAYIRWRNKMMPFIQEDGSISSSIRWRRSIAVKMHTAECAPPQQPAGQFWARLRHTRR
jgi:hypothetical protein